jgi:uncharacterized protein (TIGR02246 family)
MLHLKSMTAAAVITLVSAGVATAAGAPAVSAPAAAVAKSAGPTDRAQIQALERGLNAGVNAKDAKKVMSYYATQGLFVFDVTPPRQHVGWADYKNDWDALFAAYPGPISNEISDLSITVAGDVAYGHSIQDGHFTAGDGTKTEVVVRVTDVYRKIAGKWLIVQEHVSVPVDLATMKADNLSKP